MFESIWDDIKQMYRTGGSVTQLILINLAVFVVIHILALLLLPIYGQGSAGMDAILRWTAVPNEPLELLTRPWTIITYMFLHEGFWHILWNMLMLFWFGRIVQDLLSDRRIVPIYILGGLAGFLCYFIMANIFPDSMGPRMLGASAGVMAIVWAAASTSPDYRLHLILIGPVKIVWIAAVLLLVDLIMIRSGSNTGGHLAHIGGAAVGYLFVSQLKSGVDWGIPIQNLLAKIKNLFTGQSRPTVSRPSSTRRSRPQPKVVHKRERPTRAPREDDHQEKLDRILDKIKESGYENLTASEKEFLYNASKK